MSTKTLPLYDWLYFSSTPKTYIGYAICAFYCASLTYMYGLIGFISASITSVLLIMSFANSVTSLLCERYVQMGDYLHWHVKSGGISIEYDRNAANNLIAALSLFAIFSFNMSPANSFSWYVWGILAPGLLTTFCHAVYYVRRSAEPL